MIGENCGGPWSITVVPLEPGNARSGPIPPPFTATPSAPYAQITLAAAGVVSRVEATLQGPAALPSLGVGQGKFPVGLKVVGSPDLTLAAYDAVLEAPHAAAI